VHALATVAVGLLALTSCGSDPDPADAVAEDSAPAEATAPADESADEPADEPAEEPAEAPSPPEDVVLDESCAEIEQVLTDAQTTIGEAITDPASAQEVFNEVSANLREAAEGADPEIEAAVDQLATVYDDIAESLQTGELPDQDAMTEAATAIFEACGS
jgi:hypothetical protein